MPTHPGTAAESADSNKCICCKRSKSGGSFFEVIPYYLSGSLSFALKGWDADIDVFKEASRQDCQRCEVAFDMATTWMEDNPRSDWRHITVRNSVRRYGVMVAGVLVYLSASKYYPADENHVGLELMSANHRNLDGLVENFRNQWNIATKPLSYEDPTSDDELQGCLNCLRQCLNCHSYCTNSLSKLPKRVLELNSTTMTLRDTASSSSTERYACLSHCWGPKGPALQLTSATETRLRQGVEINSLPRTFLETVKVCMKLGIRFLWIDALCIIQGDKSDWSEAAATMADIYENAFVTIAATCAANSNDGLRPFRDRFKALRLGSSNFFVREWFWDFSRTYQPGPNKFFPLLSRAWAFQESQLAPRTLRYSCYGVILDCRTARLEEEKQKVGRDLDDNTIDLLPFFSSRDSASDPTKAWHNTIRDFSRLDLTYQTDTLPAIAALAQRMARLRRNDTYLAGMWRSTLLSDIQWQSTKIYPRQDSTLPSWSWATTQGVFFAVEEPTLHSVEILGLDYTPVGPAEIGNIKDATLTIRGPTLPLRVQAASDSIIESQFYTVHQVAFWSEQKIDFVPDYKFSPDFYFHGSQAFLALFLNINGLGLYGLVLRQVEGAYERIAWFHLSKWYMEEVEVESLTEDLARLPLTTVHII